jgi:hypothetical protein
MFTEIELFQFTNTKAMRIVTKKEKLLTVNLILTLIYCLNDSFVTQKRQTC